MFQTKSFEPPQEFFVPESENPSYRIVGGTQMLIKTLSQKLPSESLRLNSKVTSIKEVGEQLSVEIANEENQFADKVILCLPPQLAGSQINFTPNLPADVSKILPEVQTWMAGSIKFVLEYEEPFWRNSGYSGMLYSHCGIVAEMYDHTNFEKNKFCSSVIFFFVADCFFAFSSARFSICAAFAFSAFSILAFLSNKIFSCSSIKGSVDLKVQT